MAEKRGVVLYAKGSYTRDFTVLQSQSFLNTVSPDRSQHPRLRWCWVGLWQAFCPVSGLAYPESGPHAVSYLNICDHTLSTPTKLAAFCVNVKLCKANKRTVASLYLPAPGSWKACWARCLVLPLICAKVWPHWSPTRGEACSVLLLEACLCSSTPWCSVPPENKTKMLCQSLLSGIDAKAFSTRGFADTSWHSFASFLEVKHQPAECYLVTPESWASAGCARSAGRCSRTAASETRRSEFRPPPPAAARTRSPVRPWPRPLALRPRSVALATPASTSSLTAQQTCIRQHAVWQFPCQQTFRRRKSLWWTSIGELTCFDLWSPQASHFLSVSSVSPCLFAFLAETWKGINKLNCHNF